MKRRLLTLLALSLPLMSLPLMSLAQGVWRCGPDGRSYADAPCADGRRIEVDEARPADEVRLAQAQAAREIRTAEALRRERQAQDAAQRGSGLAAVGPQAPTFKQRKRDRPEAKARPALRRSAQPEADGTWRAVAPSSRRAKG